MKAFWAILGVATTILPFLFTKKETPAVKQPPPPLEPEPVLNDAGKPIKAYPIPPGYRRVSFDELPDDIKAEAVRVLNSDAQLGDTVPLREPYAAHLEEHSNAARGVSILVRV